MPTLIESKSTAGDAASAVAISTALAQEAKRKDKEKDQTRIPRAYYAEFVEDLFHKRYELLQQYQGQPNEQKAIDESLTEVEDALLKFTSNPTAESANQLLRCIQDQRDDLAQSISALDVFYESLVLRIQTIYQCKDQEATIAHAGQMDRLATSAKILQDMLADEIRDQLVRMASQIVNLRLLTIGDTTLSKQIIPVVDDIFRSLEQDDTLSFYEEADVYKIREKIITPLTRILPTIGTEPKIIRDITNIAYASVRLCKLLRSNEQLNSPLFNDIFNRFASNTDISANFSRGGLGAVEPHFASDSAQKYLEQHLQTTYFDDTLEVLRSKYDHLQQNLQVIAVTQQREQKLQQSGEAKKDETTAEEKREKKEAEQPQKQEEKHALSAEATIGKVISGLQEHKHAFHIQLLGTKETRMSAATTTIGEVQEAAQKYRAARTKQEITIATRLHQLDEAKKKQEEALKQLNEAKALLEQRTRSLETIIGELKKAPKEPKQSQPGQAGFANALSILERDKKNEIAGTTESNWLGEAIAGLTAIRDKEYSMWLGEGVAGLTEEYQAKEQKGSATPILELAIQELYKVGKKIYDAKGVDYRTLTTIRSATNQLIYLQNQYKLYDTTKVALETAQSNAGLSADAKSTLTSCVRTVEQAVSELDKQKTYLCETDQSWPSLVSRIKSAAEFVSHDVSSVITRYNAFNLAQQNVPAATAALESAKKDPAEVTGAHDDLKAASQRAREAFDGLTTVAVFERLLRPLERELQQLREDPSQLIPSSRYNDFSQRVQRAQAQVATIPGASEDQKRALTSFFEKTLKDLPILRAVAIAEKVQNMLEKYLTGQLYWRIFLDQFEWQKWKSTAESGGQFIINESSFPHIAESGDLAKIRHARSIYAAAQQFINNPTEQAFTAFKQFFDNGTSTDSLRQFTQHRLTPSRYVAMMKALRSEVLGTEKLTQPRAEAKGGAVAAKEETKSDHEWIQGPKF